MDSRRPVTRVREFNRFFTHQIGLLNEGLLNSPYSLTEVRVLFELRHITAGDATQLAAGLGLDAGYLSRILRRFVADGLVERDRDDRDARRRVLRLTARGRTVYDELDQRSSDQIAELLAGLGPQGQDEVLAAMSTIQTRLTKVASSFRIREPHTGDLGRIITRHAELYAAEHGWNSQYEALVATIMADYAASGPSAKARLWVADSGGDMVGSIMCVPDDEPDVAKLRVLLVEPHMRGHGVGGALIERCLSFATDAGYRRIRLWTVNRLTQAARLYRRFGFELESESLTSMFGDEVVAQTWGRDL
jgi:DNA-binding MarR family transcriptional regulator/GNAT superfamily N-acetyltransferase